MATVRELTTKLGFKVKEGDIKQAESRVKKMSMGMKLAITAAVGGILAIGKSAVSVAADMETLNTQFEVMLGSAEAAKEMMSDLREFSIKTPFETEDLARGATTLLQFGIQSEDVMGTLRMLGDVAGSNREKFQSLNLVYGQIMSTGRLMGQDLLQLINQGFNPLTIISKKTGKSVAQLKDEMSKGLVSAEMVTEAFRIATAEGGLFFQNMEKQSLTLTGLLSTMKGAFKEVLLDLGNALLPLIKELTKTLIELAKGGFRDLVGVLVKVLIPMLKLLSELITPLVSVITPIFDAVVKVIEPLVKIIKTILLPVFELLKPVVQLISVVFESIAIVLESLTPLFKIFAAILQALSPILIPIIAVLNIVLKVVAFGLGLLARALALVLKPVQWLIEAISFFAEILMEIFQPVFTLFNDMYNFITDIVNDIFDGVSGGLGEIVSVVKDTFKEFYYVILSPLMAVVKFAVKAYRMYFKVFGKIIEWIIYFAKIIWNKLGPVFKWIGEVIQQVVSIHEGIGVIFESIGNMISKLFGWIDELTGGLFSSMGRKIRALFNWFTDLFNSVWNWLKNIFGIFMKGPPKEKETKLKLDIKSKVPNAADAMKQTSGSRKQTNINMQNQIAITTTGGVGTAAGVKRNMEAAARSIFSLELQKLLINAGV